MLLTFQLIIHSINIMNKIYKDKNETLKGHWILDVYKGDIQTPEFFSHRIEGDNLITTSGKGVIMDRLFGLSSVGAITRIGVGTSSTTASVGDTSLTGGVYVPYDSTPTRSGLVVTCIATFGTAVGNINWQEMAMDNGTTLLNRMAAIGPYNKTSAVSIVVTVNITQN